MQQEGLKARVRKRFRVTTMSDHDQPVAPNLLGRQFTAEKPNQRWVGDTTELITGKGKLFLAVILDLFSKYVVGWALSPSNDRFGTMRALDMAIRRRSTWRSAGAARRRACSTTRTRGAPKRARTIRRSSPPTGSPAA
jgi:putative transposase